jgi:AraC-like DNA-binding protein
MIVDHQKFDLGDKCLIEKVIIRAPFRFTVNFHNEACFIYFLEGKTKINSPSEQKRVEPKNSVLLKCGSYFADLMKYSTSGMYEILVFHLYPDILRTIYKHELPAFVKSSSSSSSSKSYIQNIAGHDIIEKFVESLYFYFDNRELVSDELLELKIKELVLLLIQTKNADSILSLFDNLFTPRILSVREVVDDHLFSNISIDELASLSNLSPSTFKRTFQSMFNDTPANYIRVKRLERAKELLTISSLTVGEIAFQTCFNDTSHLSRSFKAAYGCSPLAFRARGKSD